MVNHFEAQTGTRRARREKHDAQRQDKRKHDFAVLRERTKGVATQAVSGDSVTSDEEDFFA